MGKKISPNAITAMNRLTETSPSGLEAARSCSPQMKNVTATNKAARETNERCTLFAGEALEVLHLALHLFAGRVGGGANALDAELKFVGVGGARQSFVEGDELLGVQVEERLIEGLHAVLASAGGDGVVNQAGLVRVDDAIADVGGGDHHFAGGDAAFVVGAADQALGDDGLERGRKLQTNLFLLGGRKDGDDALNRFRGIEGVQGGENQVAGFGGQDDVGILTESGAQSGGEVCGVDFDFALVDEAFLVAVEKLDGVFDGHQVVGAVGVDAVDHGREGGGLAGTGRTGHEDEAALLFANVADDRGKIELLDGADFGRNDAKDHADVATLLENVYAEAAQAGNAISHVQLGGFLELLLLAVGHHAERHGEHLFRRNAGHVGEGVEQAIDAEIRVVADLQVQVGSFAFNGAAKQIVNAECHSSVNPAKVQLADNASTRPEGGQAT